MSNDNTQGGVEPSPASAGSRAVGWRDAALRFGESLAHDGPRGYYYFTPEEWLRWATGVASSPQPTLTDAEREAVAVASDYMHFAFAGTGSHHHAATLRGLLERLG